jgi:hypothetical protein
MFDHIDLGFQLSERDSPCQGRSFQSIVHRWSLLPAAVKINASGNELYTSGQRAIKTGGNEQAKQVKRSRKFLLQFNPGVSSLESLLPTACQVLLLD